MDLMAGSPRLLRTMFRHAFALAEFQKGIDHMGKEVLANELDIVAMRLALRSKKLTPKQRWLLRSYLLGVVPSAARASKLSANGQQGADPTCPHCGCHDSLAHRFECTAFEAFANDNQWALDLQQPLLKELGWALFPCAKYDVSEIVECFIDDRKVPLHEFFFDAKAYVHLDGSVFE